jgi:uncharacterized protein YjiS (DUF1127 family)
MKKNSWGYSPSGAIDASAYQLPTTITTRPHGFLRHAIAMLVEWRNRARERDILATVDERTLNDMGITRARARFEANKPFWKP